jgi:hypothetical protein
MDRLLVGITPLCTSEDKVLVFVEATHGVLSCCITVVVVFWKLAVCADVHTMNVVDMCPTIIAVVLLQFDGVPPWGMNVRVVSVVVSLEECHFHLESCDVSFCVR